jgi:hypothetical protein
MTGRDDRLRGVPNNRLARDAGVALRWLAAGAAVALLAAAAQTDGAGDLRMDPLTAFDAKAACTAAQACAAPARGRQ